MVGLYSFAAMLAEGVAQIPLVLRQNLDPLIGGHFANGEIGEINALARKVKRTFYPVMAGLGTLAVLLYPLVFDLLNASSGLHQSWVVFAIIVAGVVLSAGYRPFLGVLLQGGYPGRYTSLVAILVVSNFALNALFIWQLGIYGAAIVNVLLIVLEYLLLAWNARRLLGVRL